MPDLRHDLELSENRRKKLKKDLVKLEKRLDETPRFIPIYDPVLREKDRRYQQETGSVYLSRYRQGVQLGLSLVH